MRDIEEIEHMLFHALTEESLETQLDRAKSQQEVFALLQTLPYFDLSAEEFQAGIDSMRESEPEDYEHVHDEDEEDMDDAEADEDDTQGEE